MEMGKKSDDQKMVITLNELKTKLTWNNSVLNLYTHF